MVVAAAVLGVGVWQGWFDSHSVTGTRAGFDPGAAPRGGPSDSWPEYGYDDRRTRSNPRLTGLRPPLREAWTHDAGALLEFPPVIGDDRVIVGTNAGRALALDAHTGRVVWDRSLPGRVASSPALAPGGLVLFTTIAGNLVALDAATGTERWRWAGGAPIESSPLVVDGEVYVGTLDGRVVRLSLDTHRPEWTARADGDVKAGLALAGDLVVVGDYSGHVNAFRRRDGSLAWRTTSPGTAVRGPGRFYGGAAVAYGRVFIGNVNGRVLALSRTTGDIAWVRVLGDFVYSSPAVDREMVYVGSYDHRVYALDAVTGEQRWSFDAGERISGSASVIGDLVWVSTIARRPSAGRTFALDADTGRRVMTFPYGRYSPAVAIDGLLVLTGVRTLHGLVPR